MKGMHPEGEDVTSEFILAFDDCPSVVLLVLIMEAV